MTKGRVALTLAAVTWDGQSRRLSAIFISLGGPKAHDSSGPTARRGRRDDKSKGGGPPWHWWRWMDGSTATAPTRFRLSTFSSTHSTSCAVQKAICALWTALTLSRTLREPLNPLGSPKTLCPPVRFCSRRGSPFPYKEPLCSPPLSCQILKKDPKISNFTSPFPRRPLLLTSWKLPRDKTPARRPSI
jgi:hypothetical protein